VIVAAALGMTIGAAFSGGCTRNPYVIGAVCPTGDGGSPVDASCPANGDGKDGGGDTTDGPGNATFAAGLDRSGAMQLAGLPLAAGAAVASLTLRGEQASATGWVSEEGVPFARGAGIVEPGLEAPFNDGTGAVGFVAGGPAYLAASLTTGDVGADDFVIEIVLRAAPGATIVDRSVGGAGWALRTDANALVLAVGDLDPTHAARATFPLSAGAWYHCLVWVSRAAGARLDCNGRAGALVPVLAAGPLDVGTPLAVGGGPVRVARLALTRIAPGGLGAPATWLDVGRRRFAALAGARPLIAMGTATPLPGVRDSLAYLDLQAAAGAPRRLFLVGPDWPRVACRTDTAGAHDCGFLSEPLRTRRVPADARAWTAGSEVAVMPGPATLAPDGPVFVALVPSAANAAHVLGAQAPDTPARQVFSFFARPGSSGRVGAHVGALGMAVYDLRAGTVVSAPAGVRATIEDWGDGTRRCIYAYTGVAQSVLHAVDLLDDAGAQAFAGDGATPAVHVAGLQVDLGLVLAGSLLASDMQPADHLTFVGDDGNLPAAAAGLIDVRVLLPEGPRLTDQAIFNLNRGTAFDDQVQLFVRGDIGKVEFWGISTGDTYWTFDHPASMTDGRRHLLSASWNMTSAHIAVDGIARDQAVLLPDPPPFVLDRIDVGFSTQSGGPLEGLVGGLRIGVP
jgi:hypothetical protein